MAKDTIYIDVMLNGKFQRQLRYEGNYHLEEDLNGNIIRCFSEKYIKEFVDKKLPSLKRKNYNVDFTLKRI